MKILVDKMPETPQECIFGVPPSNKWWCGPPIRHCAFLKMRFSGPHEDGGNTLCPGPEKCEFCTRHENLGYFNPCC